MPAARILTTPSEIHNDTSPVVTGNEWIALPDVCACDASIGSVNVLHMTSKSLLEFRGPSLALGRNRDDGSSHPLLRPLVAGSPLSDLDWDYLADWIPRARGRAQSDSGATCRVSLTLCAPVGERGFMVKFDLMADAANADTAHFAVSLDGHLGGICGTIFSRRLLNTKKCIEYSAWTKSLLLAARGTYDIAALAISADRPFHWNAGEDDGDELPFSLVCDIPLAPGQRESVTFWIAVNAETDGAATTNVHLRRIGAENALNSTLHWLEARSYGRSCRGESDWRSHEGPKPAVLARANRNLHFCRFFAHGRAIDTEQLIMATSRSPRYYVSAAFWPRDTFLWAFPAMLATDPEFAREIIITGFERHVTNMGIHAHYIDGVLLYPGFELDQLAAYIIALGKYSAATGDVSILGFSHIMAGITMFENVLASYRCEDTAVYRTFLDPSDDPVLHPYLTYDNVLVWRALALLADMFARYGDRTSASRFGSLAEQVMSAVLEHMVVEGPFGPMFAWSVDLKGNYELYDDPPGSLILLPWHGFIASDDKRYANTLAFIRSHHNPFLSTNCAFPGAGCIHSSHPWPMHACNAVLSGVATADDLRLIEKAPLDGGLACETVWESTGLAATGTAFATAAGYLSLALATSLGLV